MFLHIFRNKASKKIVVGLALMFFLFGGILGLANRAYALSFLSPVVPVIVIEDVPFDLKELLMDILAWTAKLFALNIIQEIQVEWVNTGWLDGGGESLYLPEPNIFYGKYMDEIANIFIQDKIPEFLTPWEHDLQAYFTEFYYKALDEVYDGVPDWDCFMQDWDCGGGSRGLMASTRGINNPLDATLRAADSMIKDLDLEIKHRSEELLANDGFINRKECVEQTDGGCVFWRNITPGSAAKDLLQTHFGAQAETLIAADEFSETIADLVGGFISSLFSSLAVDGLRNLSGGSLEPFYPGSPPPATPPPGSPLPPAPSGPQVPGTPGFDGFCDPSIPNDPDCPVDSGPPLPPGPPILPG